MGIGTIIYYGILAWIGFLILRGILRKINKSIEENTRQANRQKMLETRQVKPVSNFEVEFERKMDTDYQGNEVQVTQVIARMPESDWEAVKYLVEEGHHTHINCGNISHVDNDFSLGWSELWWHYYQQNNSEPEADSKVNRRVNLEEIWSLKSRGFLGTKTEKDCLVFKFHEDDFSTIDEFKEQVVKDLKHMKALIDNVAVMEDNKEVFRQGLTEKIEI